MSLSVVLTMNTAAESLFPHQIICPHVQGCWCGIQSTEASLQVLGEGWLATAESEEERTEGRNRPARTDAGCPSLSSQPCWTLPGVFSSRALKCCLRAGSDLALVSRPLIPEAEEIKPSMLDVGRALPGQMRALGSRCPPYWLFSALLF